MSATLYFLKININSHIHEIYDNPNMLRKILNEVIININDDVEYVREDEVVIDGETFTYDAHYKFTSIDKLDEKYDNSIVGSVIKTSKLFVKNIDDDTGEIKKIPVEYSEVIQFYFDVYREVVVFYTPNRFGYKEFSLAFKELLNASMNKKEKGYNFEVSLIRKNLDIANIKSELKRIGEIETLEIEIIPPNPDNKLLNSIHENGEDVLESMKEGNVTNKSILFTSSAPKGLILDSKIINDEIEKINNIHSKLSDKEALGMGYAKVRALNKYGEQYTTEDRKPIKSKIAEEEKARGLFMEVCKEKVLALFRMR